MYRTTVIIGKMSHDRTTRTMTRRRGLIRPQGTYFHNNDCCSIQYPTYYTATCQHKKKLHHSVSFYNLSVTVQCFSAEKYS